MCTSVAGDLGGTVVVTSRLASASYLPLDLPIEESPVSHGYKEEEKMKVVFRPVHLVVFFFFLIVAQVQSY